MKKTKEYSIIDVVPYEFINDTHAGLTIYCDKELLQCEYAGDARYIVEYASKEDLLLEEEKGEIVAIPLSDDKYRNPFIFLSAFTATYILVDVLHMLGVI